MQLCHQTPERDGNGGKRRDRKDSWRIGVVGREWAGRKGRREERVKGNERGHNRRAGICHLDDTLDTPFLLTYCLADAPVFQVLCT